MQFSKGYLRVDGKRGIPSCKMVETLYLSHMIAFGEDILGYLPPNTVVDGRQGIPIMCFGSISASMFSSIRCGTFNAYVVYPFANGIQHLP